MTYNFGQRVWVISPIFLLFFLFGEKHLFGEFEFGKKHSVMPVLTRINVAHRGASFLAPENTLMAFRIAISSGADGAECDVYRSSDGVIFLSHDKTTKRTFGGGDQDLTQMTYAEIQKLDAGRWKGKQFQGEKVPTLDDYLELLKDTNCHPVVEIKMEGIEQLVLESIRKQDMIKVTTIIAFSENVVKAIRHLEPDSCVAWLYSENLKDKGTAEENAQRLAEFLIRKCKELDTTVLDVNHGLLSADLVKNLQNAGIHVWCWTVNDVDRMNTLLDWGVESITTDRPELLSEILKTRKAAKK
jgi:glycerophosphoryl diester phosphodiesterase